MQKLSTNQGASLAQAVRALTVAMVEPSFGRLLVTAACVALLFEARAMAAIKAAIELAAIAAGADEEENAAMFGATKPLTDSRFRCCCHRGPQAVRVGQ